MKNRNIWHHLEEFAVGKGFYIVLALCLAAVGLSGYYLLDAALPTNKSTPTAEEGLVTIPDPVENTLEPSGAEFSRPVQQTEPLTLPDLEELQPVTEPEPVEVPTVSQPAPAENPRPIVYTWPVKGEVLRGHSLETLSLDPTMGDWRTHTGMDISAKLGTRVLCMTRGTVAEITEDDRLGTCVTVDHGDGLISTYSNLSPQPTVAVGQSLDTGSILGAVGDTALAESAMVPHLHLEVSRNGEAVDPLELLPEQ